MPDMQPDSADSTLYDCWCEENERFMAIPDLKIVAAAGVYTSRTRVTFNANGFGVPDDSCLLRPARIKLLEKRYLDEEVWEKCYERYRSQPKGATHTFLFNRRDARPKAGGCLLSIVLTRGDNGYEIMVTSRAMEATMAGLADIAFVQSVLRRIETDLGIDLSLSTVPVSWHIGQFYQNRVFVPVYFYDVYGAAGFKSWLKRRPRSKWEHVCIEHSKKMVNDDGVTGARQLWGRRLREWVFNGEYQDFPSESSRASV